MRRSPRRAGPQGRPGHRPHAAPGRRDLRRSSGRRSRCTGDPARRLGNEYLYQEQAKTNIETLNGVGAKKIIATCPHCFNSLSNEYPALGGNFEVIHHSQLLDHLVRTGKLTPGGGYKGTVTYHDPCYLGATTGSSTSPARSSTPSRGRRRSR